MPPINRVVLFKHGVGYFQRSGTVKNDELIELGFKASQMNDVLKSLTTLDYGGGTFGAISYDSEEPLKRRFLEINMSIPENAAISAFLDNVKGARISLPKGDKSIEGSVMGIEEVERMQDGAVIKDLHLAILTEKGTVVRAPLLEIEAFTFLDESIRRDLGTLLDIHFSSLRKDLKKLSIQTQGDGERELSISYVIEAPVWKTSYRIMLPEDKKTQPLIQGWALVDNTTEDDWEGVQLSLVAGLPISFIHDLYTPRYRQRPVVKVEEEAAVAPPIVQDAMMVGSAPPPEMESLEEMPPMPMKASDYSAKRMSPPAPMSQMDMAAAAMESTQIHTRTQEVGDLFAYEITRPVDIGRSRSALVPILQSEGEMERVAHYNEEIRQENPMTAFRFENTTGLTLEGGPVTVFEGDNYVGEAMLNTMRKGEKSITPYSVELGVKVTKTVDYKRESYTHATRSSQHIYKHYSSVMTTTYSFSSHLDKKVDLYLDHPFTYELSEQSDEPVEITEDFWRFRVALEQDKTTKYEVAEVTEEYESIEIPTIARKEILNLADADLISSEVKAELDKIAVKAEAIHKINEDLRKKDEEEKKIENSHVRLRENLKALGETSGEAKLRQKYVSTLTRDEERIEAITLEIAGLKENLHKEKAALRIMIDALRL